VKDIENRSLPQIIAHRGDSSRAPENTLAAFEAAIDSGAHRVEFDVQLTRDGVPVVFHDDVLDRTTNGSGPVGTLCFVEIRRLDAGSWFGPRFEGQRVPSLDEVLRLCGSRICMNVEIKFSDTAQEPDGLEDRVVGALRAHGLAEVTVVSSFRSAALERVRLLAPEIRRESLYDEGVHPTALGALEWAATTASESFNLCLTTLLSAPWLVTEAHERGLGIKVFTVDEPSEFLQVLELGVDGVFTSRPREFLELLQG
jgi:glycerophosphoryl diester phosphodiesterase